MSTPSSRASGYLAAAGTVALWTGFILLSRLAGRSPLTAWDTLALRLGTAALLLLPFSGDLIRTAWRDRRLWILALLGGLIYGVFVFAAFKYAPAAHAAILLPGMQPFLVALAAALILGSRPDGRRMFALCFIALGIVFAGVHEFHAHGGPSPDTLTGDLLLLGGSLAWAIYSVLARKWQNTGAPSPVTYDAWTLTRFVALASTALYLPVYLLWLPKALDQVPPLMLAVHGLYQGAGVTIVAMMFFLKAVQVLGAERTGALVALVPVLAGVAAAPLLGEALSPWLLAGLFCVSGGAFMAARAPRTGSQ